MTFHAGQQNKYKRSFRNINYKLKKSGWKKNKFLTSTRSSAKKGLEQRDISAIVSRARFTVHLQNNQHLLYKK